MISNGARSKEKLHSFGIVFIEEPFSIVYFMVVIGFSWAKKEGRK
jgi:hypothetical protein